MRPAKLVCVVPTPGARCSASRRPAASSRSHAIFAVPARSAPAKGGFSRKIVSSRASPAPAKKVPLERAACVVGGRAHRRNTCSDSGLIGAERAGRFPARIDGGNFVLEGGVGIESNHGLVYPRIKSGLRLATALNSVA